MRFGRKPVDSDPRAGDWTPVRDYPNRVEADLAATGVDAAGVPVKVLPLRPPRERGRRSSLRYALCVSGEQVEFVRELLDADHSADAWRESGFGPEGSTPCPACGSREWITAPRGWPRRLVEWLLALPPRLRRTCRQCGAAE